MGRDEELLTLIEGQEARTSILLRPEQSVPAWKHARDRFASRKVGRDGGLSTRLNASRGGVDMHKKVVLQLHTRGDVVKVDSIVCVLLEPGHKQPTNSEGGWLARVMGRVHTAAERVCGVREHVHLPHVLKTNIIRLINPGCNCLQFGVIWRGKTGSMPVSVQVTLLPDMVSRDWLEGKGGSRRVSNNTDALGRMWSGVDLASKVAIPLHHEFFVILVRFIGWLHNV
jgi:hypothetical protein